MGIVADPRLFGIWHVHMRHDDHALLHPILALRLSYEALCKGPCKICGKLSCNHTQHRVLELTYKAADIQYSLQVRRAEPNEFEPDRRSLAFAGADRPFAEARRVYNSQGPPYEKKRRKPQLRQPRLSTMLLDREAKCYYTGKRFASGKERSSACGLLPFKDFDDNADMCPFCIGRERSMKARSDNDPAGPEWIHAHYTVCWLARLTVGLSFIHDPDDLLEKQFRDRVGLLRRDSFLIEHSFRNLLCCREWNGSKTADCVAKDMLHSSLIDHTRVYDEPLPVEPHEWRQKNLKYLDTHGELEILRLISPESVIDDEEVSVDQVSSLTGVGEANFRSFSLAAKGLWGSGSDSLYRISFAEHRHKTTGKVVMSICSVRHNPQAALETDWNVQLNPVKRKYMVKPCCDGCTKRCQAGVCGVIRYQPSKQEPASLLATMSELYGRPTKGERDNDVCSVCLAPFGNRAIKLPECSHVFHKRCFDDYVQSRGNARSVSCMICKVVQVRLSGESPAAVMHWASLVVDDNEPKYASIGVCALANNPDEEYSPSSEGVEQKRHGAFANFFVLPTHTWNGLLLFFTLKRAFLQGHLLEVREDGTVKWPIALPLPLRPDATTDFNILKSLQKLRQAGFALPAAIVKALREEILKPFEILEERADWPAEAFHANFDDSMPSASSISPSNPGTATPPSSRGREINHTSELTAPLPTVSPIVPTRTSNKIWNDLSAERLRALRQHVTYREGVKSEAPDLLKSLHSERRARQEQLGVTSYSTNPSYSLNREILASLLMNVEGTGALPHVSDVEDVDEADSFSSDGGDEEEDEDSSSGSFSGSASDDSSASD